MKVCIIFRDSLLIPTHRNYFSSKSPKFPSSLKVCCKKGSKTNHLDHNVNLSPWNYYKVSLISECIIKVSIPFSKEISSKSKQVVKMTVVMNSNSSVTCDIILIEWKSKTIFYIWDKFWVHFDNIREMSSWSMFSLFPFSK